MPSANQFSRSSAMRRCMDRAIRTALSAWSSSLVAAGAAKKIMMPSPTNWFTVALKESAMATISEM